MGNVKSQTYSTIRGGIRATVQDAVRLYRVRTRSMGEHVDATVRELQIVNEIAHERCGFNVVGKQVLIVGAGQTPRETIAFGASNLVTAIDLDVIPSGFDVRGYVQLARQNGPGRVIKTIGRKTLGIDRRFRSQMRTAIRVASQPETADTRNEAAINAGTINEGGVQHLQMDAAAMKLASDSFDVVYSFSVFEHLPDPGAVLAEAIRVLRPGGLLYISTHMYSSEGGCHDLRIFAGDRESIPYWAHLRPAWKSTVIESCYMNERSLENWRSVFSEQCAGVEFRLEGHHEPYGSVLATELARLRALGELAQFTDEDLLSVNLKAIWVKPI